MIIDIEIMIAKKPTEINNNTKKINIKRNLFNFKLVLKLNLEFLFELLL